MALNGKSGFGLDMGSRTKRLNKEVPAAAPSKPDRMNLRFNGTNGDYVRDQASDRKKWPGGATEYINYLIEQDREKNGK